MKLKYFAVVVTGQSYIHEEIQARLIYGNGFWHSVQNMLSSPFLHTRDCQSRSSSASQKPAVR